MFRKQGQDSSEGVSGTDNNVNTQGSMEQNPQNSEVGFLPPLPRVPQGNPGTTTVSEGSFNNVVRNVGDALRILKSGADTVKKGASVVNNLKRGNFEGAMRTLGLQEESELLANLGEVVNEINVMIGKDVGGGIRNFGGNDSGFNNTTRLSLDLGPTEVSFRTGIIPDAYVERYSKAEQYYSSPLHMTQVEFQLPIESAGLSDASDFLFDAIFFELRNVIQRNINYSVSSSLTNSLNLANTFNALIYALCAYYSVARLLVYGNDPTNKNEALLALRNTLTPDVLDRWGRLRRMLQDMVIPPNLNTFIFYIHQIYLADSLPKSPVLMITTHPMDNGVPDWSVIDNSISLLLQYTDTFELLYSAIPNWSKTPLLTGISNPLHDPEFTTLWTNLPYLCTNSSRNVKGPVINGVDDASVKYNAWTNNLDGGIYSCVSIFDDSSDIWLPTLLTPVGSTFSDTESVSNRFSWVKENETDYPKFVDVCTYGNNYAALSRNETYTISHSVGVITIHHLSTEKMRGVTARAVNNCTRKMLDWFMSWNTVNKDRNRLSDGDVVDVGDKFVGKGQGRPKGPKPTKPRPKRGEDKKEKKDKKDKKNNKEQDK